MNSLTEARFLKYVSFPTMSDESSDAFPSTEKQWALAHHLESECQSMGFDAVKLDKYGYIYAFLKANIVTSAPPFGLIAHMDTSSAASDQNIKARVVTYQGQAICLNKEKNYYLSEKEYPSLADNIGHRLVVTDGSTLLGGDDKAGIAAILGGIEYIITNNIPHGDIYVTFTPDEEIGRGTDHFDLSSFPAEYAYTLDSWKVGALEYENFNAASAEITIHGLSTHPGGAKNKMKNASLLAMEFNAMLPADEIPAKTSGYEGFFHLTSMKGEVELAKLSYIIRDHDWNKFQEKKSLMLKIAQAMNDKYGESTAECKIEDSYYNMKEKLLGHMEIVERAKKAMEHAGVAPFLCPIRGGTDGARLSYEGLPCPNMGIGAYNAHSRFEYVSIDEMDAAARIVVALAEDLVNEYAAKKV